MALVILDKVKQYLDIAPAETKFDAILTDMIADVSSTIEDICQQPIEQIALYAKNIIIEEDTNYIILPYTVTTTVLSVEYSVPFSGVWTVLVDHTDYEVFYEGFMQKIWLRGNVQTQYTYRVLTATGFTNVSMPSIIKSVATEMVAMKFKESVVGENILGKQTVGTSQSGTSSTTLYKNMETKWKKDLSKYRLLTA